MCQQVAVWMSDPPASLRLEEACGSASSGSLRLSSTSDATCLGGDASFTGFFLGVAAFFLLSGALLAALPVPAPCHSVPHDSQSSSWLPVGLTGSHLWQLVLAHAHQLQLRSSLCCVASHCMQAIHRNMTSATSWDAMHTPIAP